MIYNIVLESFRQFQQQQQTTLLATGATHLSSHSASAEVLLNSDPMYLFHQGPGCCSTIVITTKLHCN